MDIKLMTAPRSELLSVKLELWHPDCWTSEVMEETGTGVLGHGSVMDGRRAFERCTIYGDSFEHVKEGVETAKESSLIENVQEVQPTPTESISPKSAIGTSSQDVFVEYKLPQVIGPAFSSQGFVLDRTSKMENGKEIWPFLVWIDRSSFIHKIESIQREYNVNITIKQISPADQERAELSFQKRIDDITPRQRQAFELARKREYYEWPRKTSIQNLANELGVSKATFLEHLRSAESYFLDPPETRSPSE